jgi:hypothetical protein
VPDPTVTTDKKPRRRKAKRPAADPATPRKPRTTLLSRIEAMGPTHLAAYRTLANGNAAFVREVADALTADSNHARAVGAVYRATGALDAAEQRLTDADRARKAGREVLARLDTLARQIATARGDVPATDDAHAAPVAPEPDAD